MISQAVVLFQLAEEGESLKVGSIQVERRSKAWFVRFSACNFQYLINQEYALYFYLSLNIVPLSCYNGTF